MPKKSLAETHPEIAKQWHPTKNGGLTPNDVTSGSGKSVWWKCDKGDDHEWKTTLNNRSAGSGCSICRGRTIVKSNCLSTTHPELAEEWHPTKNVDLTPFDVFGGSTKKIWWKCKKGSDHEWRTSLINRTRHNSECPVCSNKKIVFSNCLATTHPELAEEWHPTKNVDLTPYDISIGSNKKVWWKCSKGEDHEWKVSANSRKGCPGCSNNMVVKSNCLSTTHPEIAKEWHPTKNEDLTPFQITAGSNKKVWWKCDKGDDHEWKAQPNNIKNGDSCPICSGRKIVLSNCLATLNPEIAKEWHPTKNGDLTPFDVGKATNKMIWWKCNKGDDHEWKTTLNNRNGGDSCPICSRRKVVLSNCLATTNPELAKQWHPTKNGDLTPFDVVDGVGQKLWWEM